MGENLIDEIKNADFLSPISYKLFNKLDDDYVINRLNKKYDEIFDIEDFEVHVVNFTDKEKFLLKMHNKQFTNKIMEIVKEYKSIDEVNVFVDHEEGLLEIVKLKCYKLI